MQRESNSSSTQTQSCCVFHNGNFNKWRTVKNIIYALLRIEVDLVEPVALTRSTTKPNNVNTWILHPHSQAMAALSSAKRLFWEGFLDPGCRDLLLLSQKSFSLFGRWCSLMYNIWLTACVTLHPKGVLMAPSPKVQSPCSTPTWVERVFERLITMTLSRWGFRGCRIKTFGPLEIICIGLGNKHVDIL